MAHESFSRQNMSTGGNELCLHGNVIAAHGTFNGASGVWITLAGWNTPTTKERLKGILSVMGHQGTFPSSSDSPILSIWTTRGQTFIGEVSKPDRDAIELDSNDWVFVIHPSMAVGMSALAYKIDKCWPSPENFSLIVP